MKRKLIITLLGSIAFSILIFSHNVNAASINSTDYTLDEILNSEDKIMQYDAITGETTEVDMEELKTILKSSFNVQNDINSNSYYDPYENIFSSQLLQSRASWTRYIDTRDFTQRVTCKITTSTGAEGSAVLVGPNLALTAAHCIWKSDTKEKRPGLVF